MAGIAAYGLGQPGGTQRLCYDPTIGEYRPVTTTTSGGNLQGGASVTPVKSTQQPSQPSGGFMSGIMSEIKDYFKKHRDIIVTIGLFVLADHLFFKDALRSKLQNLVEKLLTKVETKVNEYVG